MRYRLVDVRIWGDEKFRRLSPLPPCGQGLFLYLLTTPLSNSIPGLFRVGEHCLAEELGWDLKAFREAFREGFQEGLYEADFRARVLFIPNAIKYNRPQSPNVIKSWSVHWDEIPECELKNKSYQVLKAFAEGLGKGFQEAFAKALPKPSRKALPNQEQEQEQEHKEQQQRDIVHSGFDLNLVGPGHNPNFQSANQKLIANVHSLRPTERSVTVICEGFERFWNVYPRKENKKKALGLWRNKKLDSLTDAIVADVQHRISKHEQWKNPKFIPHATTYLNGERWNDEIIINKQESVSKGSGGGYAEQLKRAGEIMLASRNVSPIQSDMGEEVD